MTNSWRFDWILGSAAVAVLTSDQVSTLRLCLAWRSLHAVVPVETAFSSINAVEAAYRRHSSVSSSSSSMFVRLFTSIAISSDVSEASPKSVSTGSPGSFSLIGWPTRYLQAASGPKCFFPGT